MPFFIACSASYDGRADAADAVEPLLDQVEDLLVARVGAQRR